jgi:hypothetical protein
MEKFFEIKKEMRGLPRDEKRAGALSSASP